MYHSPSGFRQLFTRFLVYFLMTLTVAIMVTVSVLYLLGYRFDNTSHRIEQSGLVQYISRPNGADVSVDGTSLSQKTPSNSSVSTGKHTFTYTRDGYQTWQKTLTIQPGTLTWLNYARMVPVQLSASAVVALPEVSQAIVSPSRQFMVVLARSDRPSVSIYDLASDAARSTSITISESDYSKGTDGAIGAFSIVEWDSSSRYLLMKHTVGKSVEWLVLDRVGGELASNVTKTIDLQITAAHIIDQDGPTLISLIDDDIRKVNLDRETVSRPVVSSVADFGVDNKNIITYISVPDAKHQRRVGIVADGGAPVDVYTVSNQKERINVTAGHYFDEDYVAISEGKRVILFAGEFPRKQTEVTLLKKSNLFTFPSEVRWLQMSPEDRFVVAQTGGTYQTYDIERRQVSDVLQLGSDAASRKLEWLDNYYLYSSANGVLCMVEFDGANSHDINEAAPGLGATITPDGKYIYSINKTKAGTYQLQRVSLLL